MDTYPYLTYAQRAHFEHLHALEDAIAYRTARLAIPCPHCGPRRCDDHAADTGLITAYHRTAHALITRATATGAFFSPMDDDQGVRTLLFTLPEDFPWVRFLPAEYVKSFLAELVETIRASADLGNLAAVTSVVAAWKATAEIHSIPTC